MSRSQQRFSGFRSNEQRSAVAASDWLSAGQRAVDMVSDVDLVQFAITQEEWLRFQEHSPDGFILLHPAHDSAQRILNFQLIYANQSAQRMLGQKSSDLLGRRLLEIVPAMEVSLDRLVEAFESGVGQVIQQRIETRTGTCRWRIVAARLGDGLGLTIADFDDAPGESNSEIGMPGRQHERETDEAAALLDLVLAGAPIGIALLDHDLRYIMVNQVMAEINGLAVEEYRGKHIADVIPHIASQVKTIAQDVLRNGKAIIGPEVATETAAGPGQQRVWRTKYYPIPALPGGPGVGVVVEDISESRAAEARLHENELRWRRLMDANVVGIVISDTERVIDVNRRFLDMVGYRREELMGEFRRVKLTPVEFAELDKAAREQLRSVGAVRPFEKEFVRKDGSRVPVLITGARLQEAPLSWIGFVMDLTELKHAERQMRESELRWRRLAESSIAGILVTNEERVLEANKAYLDIIGYSEEELKAGKVLRANLTPPEYQSLDRRGLEQLRQTGHTMAYQKEYRRRDGTRVPVLLAATTLTETPLMWVGLVLNLTVQKRAEAVLRQSEEQPRALTRAAPVFLFNFRLDGECEYASQYYYEFTGRPDGSAAGGGWLEAIEPEDRRRITTRWNSAREAGEAFEVEYRLRRRDGAYRWFKASVINIRDNTGQIVRWYGGSIDIHDQKEIQAALEEADRRKDEFLAMLAHELCNPLAPIVNAIEIMRRIDQHEARMSRALELIERQTGHLTQLVDELLEVSRITTGKILVHKEVIEIGNILTQALESAHPLMESRKHQVEVILPDEPLQVEGDPMRLTQVFLNLLNNAAKYTPERGKISLQAAREGEQIIIRVRDNGYGISSQLMPHIFDLFTQGERTLDRAQGGLGIGLTISRRLVELHSGTVEAFSRGTGQGSEFTIRLPRLINPDRAIQSLAVPLPTLIAGRRILVVDDNVDCADTMAELLTIGGFDVAVARDGKSAIESVRSFKPDVVLLDIGLPGMDGYEVAQRLLSMFGERKPVLIATSGYGQERDRERSRLAGFNHHLVKPISYLELLKIVSAD